MQNLDKLASKFSLLDEAREIPADDLIAPHLASYLPFVGANWPWEEAEPRRPRVIVYGMAQNLAAHPDEVSDYLTTEDKGLTRLQGKWKAKKSIGIRPWQTMHAQIVAAFALRALESTGRFKTTQGCVTKATAITNFVKWSYKKPGKKRGTIADRAPDKVADYEPAYPYVKAELHALTPDVVIAMGRKVEDAFARIGTQVPVVYVAHSSGQVTNRLAATGRLITDLHGPDEMKVACDALVERWSATLDGLQFRKGDDDGSVQVTADDLMKALRKDWLYYALAERQIRATVASMIAR